MSGTERFWWAVLAFWALLLGLDLAFGSGTARWLDIVSYSLGIVLSVMLIRTARRSRTSTEAGDDE
jgi:membrane protein implicated in regulation of membrane protease activity